ncbi:hypothetical protein SKAU_G00153530 [Synaphobranchus kaupii]|uniref:Uncharacterized protein n=1 Tax=Synaphobranchus kaupii TaxID=118154 RepID=A0A9Q1FH95_SYNKA|nr:hypothetical protein SKAU_G00153530 [Synaphobranchus kaupii]
MFGRRDKNQVPTSEKGVKAVPKVSNDYLIKDTKGFIHSYLKLEEMEKYIENKYGFQVDEVKVWSLNDKEGIRFEATSDPRPCDILRRSTALRQDNEVSEGGTCTTGGSWTPEGNNELLL